MTVGDLGRLLDFLRKDGLQDESPVIIVAGNPHVTSKGALMARQGGYYSAWVTQRTGQAEAMYLSVQDPCIPSTVEWDEFSSQVIAERRDASDAPQNRTEAEMQNWERLSDETFRLANAVVSRKGA